MLYHCDVAQVVTRMGRIVVEAGSVEEAESKAMSVIKNKPSQIEWESRDASCSETELIECKGV